MDVEHRGEQRRGSRSMFCQWLNTEVTSRDAARRKRSGRLLMALTFGWVVLFSYLLLTSDPPDIGPIHLRSFENSGHLWGSLLLGFLVFAVLARWTGRPGRAVPLSLAATLAFLLGVELLQELRPGRGYQRIDVELNLVGSVTGVALAWTTHFVRARFRKRGGQSGDVKSGHL